MNLIPYLKAKYPILYIVTPEEARAEVVILNTAKALNRRVRIWSFTEGFFATNKEYKPERIEDPIDALTRVKSTDEENDVIFVMRDLHCFFGEPKVLRKLRDIASNFKQLNKTLIIVSPTRRIPPDLERDITVLEFELPRRSEIEAIFKTLYTANVQQKLGKLADDEHERVVQAAMGLTTMEAENAFSKAIVETAAADKNERQPLSRLVLIEKANAVKKNGILEYSDCKQGTQDIGGLENLKEWLATRSRAFSRKAREFGLPMPRGVLLVGLPGCGKSLSAKAASTVLGVPLIRFDIGKVFGGLVGESEANMRTAIQTAEAIGNCVLWIDELEKGLAGTSGNGNHDGGTSQRVFGHFLTWMQEKTAACFIIATVNRIAGLPPELLRKGRFDEIFFVGLPSAAERTEILKIHIRKYGRKPADFAEKIFKQCTERSEGFSGAEIEESVVSALYSAFHHDREVTGDDILAAIQHTNPLSKSRAEELMAMADWAQNNAVNASKVDPSLPGPTAQAGRQLDV